ncbi:MAG: sigma-54-dependent Fis family transcriptional regulator [Bordetella sp. SCN 67-23]|nr:sigma-54-dependent Fis family transcriptional regulator [Burkholderiales bacterium]ODS71256.1 MAG: sigma-54-dependent Fis family transcriptional regulator [Bordetella sp. SCN 67-23]ODU72900.1 MAG: sigma-54-dependent Fis family transcriptional regulator [Bordetella sp. SCN 68-11]OJW91432.1 MAG: sigma-54-dependent Fis family transcriptional regulator [Burkholderiales bacterium 67-32]
MPHVLIVDDEPNTRAALAEIVGAEGFTTAVAGDLREARIQIVRQSPDVVLTDLKLPDGSGMDLFKELDPSNPAEVILITGHASVESAVDALRLGAADYLIKPINMQRLKAILDRIPRSGDLKAEIGSLRGELRRFGRFGRMLGGSPAMQDLYDQVGKVAPTEATVLLIGESGTGKELAAQTLHDLSLRRKRPFLAVNCGAISPNLIESEMFGHERGSFTGAERQHKGYFERSHGGTLFLDEITEMPIELQVKLLRVLETGLFMRVGTNQETECDARIIAATNRNPQEAVAEGKLREDLYHRLNVFPIHLPPLRERAKDVELLAQSFLDLLNETHKSAKVFSPAMLADMASHAWPGNVRELKNYVHRAFIMTDGGLIDTVAAPIQLAPAGKAESEPIVTIPVGTSLAEADRRLIFATLQHCGGVKKHAAEVLGISLKTLYNRLEDYAADDAREADMQDVPVS